MSTNTNLPSYEELFGALDFKKGDDARSVYSPAAYLADLLQLMEDEFLTEENPIHQRRADIKSLILNAENTFTITPYLDIVNEVLENEITGDTYEVLKQAKYPLKMPFHLENEQIKQSLQYLNITSEQLYKIFADRQALEQETIAREYLGLSVEELEIIHQKSTGNALKKLYGNISTLKKLQHVPVFLETTGITGSELRILLYQNLSEKEKEANLAQQFYTNQGLNGFAILDGNEENINWNDGSDIPQAWFERTHRFIRLAKKIKINFTDLDLILRSCCNTILDVEALKKIAVVKHFNQVYDLPVAIICAFFSPVNTVGVGNEAEPADLFNTIFNKKYTPIDQQYILGSQLKPIQYEDDQFSELGYAGDLLSDHNKIFRKRLGKALHISDSDLTFIIEKFKEQEIEESLWSDPAYKLLALSVLFRLSRFVEIFDISYEELFFLFDILEKDPSIRNFSNFNLLIDYAPAKQSCYEIIKDGDVTASMWLVQLLAAIVKWMQAHDFSAEALRYITTGEYRDEAAAENNNEQKIKSLDELYKQFKPLAVKPDMFIGDLFDHRTAQSVYRSLLQENNPIISKADHRLIRYNHKEARQFGYHAISELDLIKQEDFKGLGIEEKLTDKIFNNLIFQGYLSTKGVLKGGNFPKTSDDFKIETDFSAHKENLFRIIHMLYTDEAQRSGSYEGYDDEKKEAKAYKDMPAVDFSVFPSDLEILDIPETQRNELYDNLIFNGYIDEEGNVLQSHFCATRAKLSAFEVNANIGSHAEAVFHTIDKKISGFEQDPLLLDKEIFSELPITDIELEDLVENLKFNEYINHDNSFTTKEKLLTLDVKAFNLALQFYPHRQKILSAIQQQIAAFKSRYYHISKETLSKVADDITAHQIYERIKTEYLEDSRLSPNKKLVFRDTAHAEKLKLGQHLNSNDTTVVFNTINAILTTSEKYQFTHATLEAMEFDQKETKEMIELLQIKGYIDHQRKITESKLDELLNIDNTLQFNLESFEDYNKDIFFILHAIAKETDNAIGEIAEKLRALATQQENTLYNALQETFEIEADIIKAIAGKIFRGSENIMEAFMLPVYAVVDAQDNITREPEDSTFNLAYRRMQQLARLIIKLKLSKAETEVILHDQDLIEKFPEKLALPEGVNRFDALLEGIDGVIYIFVNAMYYVYHAENYKQLTLNTEDDLLKAFIEEHETLKELLDKPNTIKALLNTDENIEKVDAAFTDHNGTGYIIAEGQYYSKEKGSKRWVKKDREWGKVESNFDIPEKIDAAFQDKEGKTYLFSGDQYIRYSGDYNTVDKGYPKKIEGNWKNEGLNYNLPKAFQMGIDASFQGKNKKTYLFKDDQYLCSDDLETAMPVREMWAKVKNNFTSAEKTDAAYTDGHTTYVFAGDQVIAYQDSTENDQAHVQEGYPRTIASHIPNLPDVFQSSISAAFKGEDGKIHLFKGNEAVSFTWGEATVIAQKTKQKWGIVKNNIVKKGIVDAAFVGLDGKTYLFSDDQYVRYSDDNYDQADEGYPRLISNDWGGLTKVDAAFVLDGKTYLFEKIDDDQQKYVCYSTNDYTTPDEEYPRASGDNWLNLPFALVQEGFEFANIDAVFNDKEGKTYLFKGNRFVVYDNNHRWWSEPHEINTRWNSIPFDSIDAAFTGKDGRTYLFSAGKYIRYSTADYSKVDDRYPVAVKTYWGKIQNNITETGKVDAAVVLETRETIDDVEVKTIHTYLFSGNQYFRYKGDQYKEVESGYPRYIHTSLREEPRFKHLETTFEEGIDAAFADHRNVYLFKDKKYQIIAEKPDHTYENIGFSQAGCAFLDEGALFLEEDGIWYRYSSIEGKTVQKTPAQPAILRDVPDEFKSNLNAVLTGTDQNTYLFKGPDVFNVSLNKAYPLHEEWGRAKNNIYIHNTIDAAFVGTDGKTYLFSKDQYVCYSDEIADYENIKTEALPQPIAAQWGGLNNVTLAFVEDGKTYLFEKPDQGGKFRYLRYSGKDYTRPDEGYPKTDDFGFWEIPEQYIAEGFNRIDTVIIEKDNMLLIHSDQYLRFNTEEQTWAYPKPLHRIWHDIPLDHEDFKNIKTAFTGIDGAVYFFSEDHYVRYENNAFTAPAPIKETWGLTDNNFVNNPLGNKVDAAFVYQNKTTYLFSGHQYVRYSSNDYRYADETYPKDIAENLRKEEAFKNVPEDFEDRITELREKGENVFIDAVVANNNNNFIFIGENCHVVSQNTTHTRSINHLSRVKNNILKKNSIDAAFVNDSEQVFLFSGDQYVRYSEDDYEYVDDGYPKTIAQGLSQETGIGDIPDEFSYGIDAALRGKEGNYYLFKAKNYYNTADKNTLPVAATWGKVINQFVSDPDDTSIDAAFISPNGKCYVFKQDQYIRYTDLEQEFVDEGFPKPIKDHWGNMPFNFEIAIDSGFVFEGKTYFIKGEEYIRYSNSDYQYIDSIYPQKFPYRWGAWSDYLLSDIKTITRYKQLQETYSSEDHTLTDLLHTGKGYIKEPYKALSDIFGWDIEEIKWLKRHNAFLTSEHHFEVKLNLELLIKMFNVFSITEKAGIDPSTLYHKIWKNLYTSEGNTKEAIETLYTALGSNNSEKDWNILSGQMRDERNILKRNALVSYSIAHDETVKNARELYEKLLIDVQMDSCAATSRIKEAIAAVQLYLHRYFLNLEQGDLKGDQDEAVRKKLKERWKWLKSYRVWEANRKVFLYPENYIRPELRDIKTPAFKTLEEDLLQTEINENTAQWAYKKYLDEYTEVSRLNIAGGYVYDEPGSQGQTKSLILFGHTKTDPKRYYYRLTKFIDGTGVWDPWLGVNVQIDADKVYPVFAFNKTFVFWTKVEAVMENVSETELTVTTSGDNQKVKNNNASKYIIKIQYAFHDLNKEWVQAQTLAGEIKNVKELSHIDLFVENSDNLDLPGKVGKHENIVINCSYKQVGSNTAFNKAFILTPELDTEETDKPKVENKGREIFSSLFDEPGIDDVNMIMLNSTEKSSEGPWFSFDYKGGSFLCKPAIPPLGDNAWALNLKDNPQLPDWKRIDAAFQGPDGTSYFFNNERQIFVTSDDLSNEISIKRWGRNKHNNIAETGQVDAAYINNNTLYVLQGGKYLTYSQGLDLADHEKVLSTLHPNIPKGWKKMDAAFKGPDGTSYFINNDEGKYVTSNGINAYTTQKWTGLVETMPIKSFKGHGAVRYLPLNAIIDGKITDTQGQTYPVFGAPQIVPDDTFGSVLSFDGVDDYAELPGNSIPQGDEITISLWTYSGDNQPNANSIIIASKGRPSVRNLNIHLPWRNGRIYFDCGYSENAYDRIDKAINVEELKGKWIHWTFTKQLSTGTMEIYKDGALWHSESGKNKPLNVLQNVKVNIGLHGNAQFYQGKMAHLRIYDRVLSQEEIQQSIIQDMPKPSINAALSVGNKTFLFSGDQYVRYTGSDYKLDKGYPKPIKDNKDNFPKWNKIDAAFYGPDGKSYFFNNDKQVFVSSDDIQEEIPIREKWGIVRNHFLDEGTVDSAYVQKDKLFLISKDQFVRYTLSDNKISDYVDTGYPKSFKLPVIPLNKVQAAFAIDYDDMYNTYIISGNRFLKYTRSDKEVFDNGRYIEGRLGVLLEDIGFDLEKIHLPYRNLPVHSAYFHNNILYIHSYFYTLTCNLKNKTISQSYSFWYYFKSAYLTYVNADNVVQKTTSHDYDAGFVAEFEGEKTFYLFKGEEYIETNNVPATAADIQWKNPKKIAESWGINKVDASFSMNGKTHLWSKDVYFSLEEEKEPDVLTEFKYIQGSWGNIPYELRFGFNASLNTGNKLYLFKNDQYIEYDLEDIHEPIPYEIENAQYEIIRLTASTAYKLNQKLFSGGIPALLNLSTQEENELPTFSREIFSPTTIRVKDKVTRLPVSSHLDFYGANGLYYWEMFFHAPFLIAQTFNTDQKFEEAKTWYEYIYDPTEVSDYWKFLPFLAIDIEALMRSITAQLEDHNLEASAVEVEYNSTTKTMADLLGRLSDISVADPETAAEEAQQLKDIKWDAQNLPDALGELMSLVGKLHTRYLPENTNAQIETYLNDPFDPHAIASLRQVAYRKAVVMHYIDNLIDWGDIHFRQYTMERIDEARMLYQLAYNLLGTRPDNLGTLILTEEGSYEDLINQSVDYDFLLELENAPVPETTPTPVTMASTVHDSVDNPYFFIPENLLFTEYWNRVEDRLYKIRHCLNIEGIKQPLPLFQPPIDPMAVVQAVSGGASLGVALTENPVMVPHYRFSFMLAKAQDLAFTLTRFGGELLGTLEKKDAEALSMLQNKQEGIILDMTQQLKEAQLGEIEETLNALEESKKNAIKRKEHYSHLIAEGMLHEEKVQVKMMFAGGGLQATASGLKIGSTYLYGLPQITIGPFSFGSSVGGKNWGEALSKAGEALETGGESLSMIGEAFGVRAQHERMEQDWEIQQKMAESDEAEIEAQIASAQWRKKAAQRELIIYEKEVEHHATISKFMKNKFTNEQLYQWHIGKLSGFYHQTYKLTYDIAKQAEKAFQFERGLKESEVNYIRPGYWNSQKKGLLAGEGLSLDIDRMEKAYLDNNSRNLEISKNISLLELDPMAFLQLKSKGVCEFTLNEAHFDYDFPGHYCRQVKTIALTFDIGEGQAVMATLTQLNHKTVLEPNAKAVKFLLDPKGSQPQGIRSNWRATQQIALSHHDEYEKNNGLFELRFDNDRYLPFEGTGAVSTWRLELNGKKGSYNMNELLEVTINLKYTAKQGGEAFVDAVKGMLKPYPTVRFFDMHHDFPGQWNEFISNDSNELILPLSRSLFPNMRGGKISGIFTKYDRYEPEQVKITLGQGDGLPLDDGKYLPTTGLSIPGKGTDWVLRIKGNKANLRNIQFVIGYQANA